MNTEKLYEENQDFKEYVDRASHTRSRPKDEILKLKMAELVGGYYDSRRKNLERNSRSS